jgi:hypothetical protein
LFQLKGDGAVVERREVAGGQDPEGETGVLGSGCDLCLAEEQWIIVAGVVQPGLGHVVQLNSEAIGDVAGQKALRDPFAASLGCVGPYFWGEVRGPTELVQEIGVARPPRRGDALMQKEREAGVVYRLDAG